MEAPAYVRTARYAPGDTYRIVAQVSRYVSHPEIRYRDNTTSKGVIS